MALLKAIRGAPFSRSKVFSFPIIFTLAIVSGAVAQAKDGMSIGSSNNTAEAFRKNVTLLGVPSATAVSGGYVFASVGKFLKSPERDELFDGSGASAALGVGIDLGAAIDLQLTANITSLTDSFADSGFFSAKASRRIDSGGIPVYVGVMAGHLGGWGDTSWRDPTVSAAITAFPTFDIGSDSYPLMLTLGAGTDVREFNNEPGIFAGVGIGMTESLGSSIAWNGDDLDVGLALRHEKLDNWGTALTLNNVTNRFGLRRLTVSVNWISDKLF